MLEHVPTEIAKRPTWRESLRGAGAVLSSRPVTVRWILAGPIALILAILSMAAMPLWLPVGAAGVNHIAMPIVLFPAIWTAAVMYPVLDDNLVRATAIMMGIIVVLGLLIFAAFS